MQSYMLLGVVSAYDVRYCCRYYVCIVPYWAEMVAEHVLDMNLSGHLGLPYGRRSWLTCDGLRLTCVMPIAVGGSKRVLVKGTGSGYHGGRRGAETEELRRGGRAAVW